MIFPPPTPSFDLADPAEAGHGTTMAPKLALAACIMAALAACSPSQDPSGNANVSGHDERSRAKWPLPAEPAATNDTASTEMSNNQTEVAPVQEPEAVKTELPSSDLASYRARGTEPFWSVTIVGGTLVLDRPGVVARYFSVSRSSDGGIRRYSGEGIKLSVLPGPCNDGMSDQNYADRVQISLSDGVLKGCGIPRANAR